MHLANNEERNCVNTETVVFFYVLEKTMARRYPWQKVEFKIDRIKWGERKLVAAGIPEYDYNRKNWRKEVIRKKITTELVEALGIERYGTTNFMIHKSLFDTELGRIIESVFPLELISLSDKSIMAKVTPEDVVKTFIGDSGVFDALIVADNIEEVNDVVYHELPELVAAHCNGVNYLGVITDNPENYVEVFEELNEEYGLTGITFGTMEQVKLSPKYKVLVIDGSVGDKHTWRYLPPCCTYIDLISSSERQRTIEARRKDVRYISFYRQVSKKIHQKI